MMRSSNPVLSNKAFEQYDVYESTGTMTVAGTAMKTGILLVLVITSAAFVWKIFTANQANAMQAAMPWMIGGLLLVMGATASETPPNRLLALREVPLGALATVGS